MRHKLDDNIEDSFRAAMDITPAKPDRYWALCEGLSDKNCTPQKRKEILTEWNNLTLEIGNEKTIRSNDD